MAYTLLMGFLRWLVDPLMALLGGFRATGIENVPREGGVIIAPNHRSLFDPFPLGYSLPRRVRYMASTQIFAVPVVRWLASILGAFPVKQDSPDRAALRQAESLLKSGEAIVIFPEGHVSPTGALEPIQPGVILLALRTGVPIVPVGIAGTERVMPYGVWWLKASGIPIVVKFGRPLFPDELSGGLKGRAALDHGAQALARALSDLVEQAESMQMQPRLTRGNLPVA